jgi:predicted transcriptional regulator
MLLQLAGSSTEFTARLLRKVANRCQKYFGSTPAQKKQALVIFLAEVEATVPEIAKTTGWPRQEVYDLIKQLADEDLVTIKQYRPSGRGREMLLVSGRKR